MADKRTVNIHGKEYEIVASRVERFLKENKGFAIRTKIIEADETHVVMKAAIYTPEGFIVATGHADERRDASMINKTSALENCETSAIGRALACFGYNGGEFASADEVANAISQQGQNLPPLKAKATEKQVKYLYTLAKNAGIHDADKAKARIMEDAGVEDMNDLTPQKASELIEKWAAWVDDNREDSNTGPAG